MPSAAKSKKSKKSKSQQSVKVVALKRSKGVIVQNCDVYIGRAVYRGDWRLAASEWANPFTVRNCGGVEQMVSRYEDYLLGEPDLMAKLCTLRGKTLGCWCKKKDDEPCHGDVIKRFVEEGWCTCAKCKPKGESSSKGESS
ncbi:hypothetical protein HDV00_010128 [Rhizophlyctis rosea]|nr:hypothetical protein HDV00_010128 [Rhizophlyctis rosea]